MIDYDENIPIQYQRGFANFMGMNIRVDHRVLIPRPETEQLVKITAELCGKRSLKRPRILEMGTGSGIILLGLKKLIKDCQLAGVDISRDALTVARANLERYNEQENIKLVVSDMFSAFTTGDDGVFDCIVSNPPYVSDEDYEKLDTWVKAEPRIALYAGKEGMDHLNIIAAQSSRFLVPGGLITVEVGYDQASKVKQKFREYGFIDVEGFEDLNGYERVIVGWKNG